MMVASRTGVRSVWFFAIGICLAALTAFALANLDTTRDVRAFLIVIQTSTVGLHFAVWALLPDTVEWGQRATRIRNEAMLYGYAALIQRLAIGAGTLLLGLGLLREDALRASAGSGAFRLTLALLPMAFFALAGALMFANPLRRGSHDRVVAELNEAA